ncbi:hypothetical protein B0H11DRAFT_720850 [Mycena galericulata]|nr:hypothetical protein B0H11DRAFT_720850 [Mycena galericulata]
MENVHDPLSVQELVDRCIDFLHESTPDLKACALVARSWVYRAQSHLFDEAVPWYIDEIKHIRQWGLLLPILQRCPHFIRHIHRLHISGGLVTRRRFSEISLLQFAHLEEVTFTRFLLSDDAVVAMARLLSLPTLRRVDIHCGFHSFETFLEVWTRCSPTVKAVVLDCWDQSPHDFYAPPPRAAPIALQSLTIEYACDSVIRWLHHESCPFELSHLKALSIYVPFDQFIGSPRFALAFLKIEALHLEMGHLTRSDALSLFPNLKILRLNSTRYEWSKAIDIFSTLPRSNCLRKIVLSGYFKQYSCDKLDSMLSQLLIDSSAMVELQPFEDQPSPVPYFPELASRGRLYQIDYHPRWFDDEVAML